VVKYSRRLHKAMLLAAFAALFVLIGSAYCQSGTIEYDQAKGGFVVMPKGKDSIGSADRMVWHFNSAAEVISINIHGEIRIFNTLVGVDTLAAIEVLGRWEPKPPEPPKGRCPECNKLGWKSTVEMQMLLMTPAVYYGPPRWNEDGNFINPSPHRGTSYKCSKGHEWTE